MSRLIDADALEAEFAGRPPDWYSTGTILRSIDSAPTIDAVPVVRGKWIEYTRVVVPEPYNKWEQAWKCDKCGFDDGFPAYNFCPNCGADMRGNHEQP